MLYKKLGDPDHSGMADAPARRTVGVQSIFPVMGAATNLILHGPATACAIAADIRDCQIELVIAIGITDSDCPKSNSIASVLMAAWGMSKDKKEPFAWSNASGKTKSFTARPATTRRTGALGDGEKRSRRRFPDGKEKQRR
jgi:hypothetical protein